MPTRIENAPLDIHLVLTKRAFVVDTSINHTMQHSIEELIFCFANRARDQRTRFDFTAGSFSPLRFVIAFHVHIRINGFSNGVLVYFLHVSS